VHAVSQERLEDLVNRYGRLISAAVARVGGSRLAGQHEDVEQEVLLALWRQVRGEQTIHHPSSYLYRAAVRETVRALRRRAARGETSIEDATAAEPASTAANPERSAASQETVEAIHRALQDLGPERRLAVQAHLAGFDVKEIMRMQGWPYQKARNLIARGMADLRQRLLEAGIHA
jgi:RNA polymerase sigma factor (sigma-70 family)